MSKPWFITKYGPYAVDFLVFVGVMIVARYSLLMSFSAPFFLSESSDAFMQFTYYLKALRTGASLYWDQYVTLGTQGVPTTPLLSPFSMIMVAIAMIFDISNIKTLATIFAATSYLLAISTGFTMYLLLRFLSMGRLAAIIGGIAYSYSTYASQFGLFHGDLYRTSALALIPLVFLQIFRLFGRNTNVALNTVIAGALLGICLISNGDIKPTFNFVPLMIAVAYFEGWHTHGWRRTTVLMVAVLGLAAAIAAPQIYPTYQVLKEGMRSEWTAYRSAIVLHPDNTILGFSQNAFSFVMGLLFPQSFFDYFHLNEILGISSISRTETRFSFGVGLLVIAAIGAFYTTRRHVLWLASSLVFVLYMLGSNTPLWPIFGVLSEYGQIRYPTRSSIVIYFILSVYVAYGISVLLSAPTSEFYRSWAKAVEQNLKFCLVVLGFLGLAATVIYYSHLQPYAPSLGSVPIAAAALLLFALALTLVAPLVKRETSPSVNARLHAAADAWMKHARITLWILLVATVVCFLIAGFLHAGNRMTVEEYTQAWHEFRRELSFAFSALVLGSLAIWIGLRVKYGRVLLLSGIFAIAAGMFTVTEPVEPITPLPKTLANDVSTIMREYKEFRSFSGDPALPFYRVYVPLSKREVLGTEDGFARVIHSFCCRQYLDELRFAFGLVDAGPKFSKPLENLLNRDDKRDYGNAFWKFYNVKYIVDGFEKDPKLLPKDPGSYERVAEDVIRLKDTKPVLYFTSQYFLASREEFVSVLVARDLLDTSAVYLHDLPENTCSVPYTGRSARIRVVDFRSGQMQAQVSSETPGLLVFSEHWVSPWRVFIDGKERKVLRANGLFQAVEIGPGEHNVVFKYDILRMLGMRIAIIAAIIAWLMVLGVIILHKFGALPSVFLEHPVIRTRKQVYFAIIVSTAFILSAVYLIFARDRGVIAQLPPCLDSEAAASDYVSGDWKPISLRAEAITLSSMNDPKNGQASLIDKDPETFWHINNASASRLSSVAFDLGSAKTVGLVRVLPRPYFPNQFWAGLTAFWEGSNDGKTWTTVAALPVDKTRVAKSAWVTFPVPYSTAYRFYRIQIGDPNFLSISEVELFSPASGDIVQFDEGASRKRSPIP